MRAFELYDATTVEGAVELLRKNSDRAVKVVGGGSDLIGGMMKDWGPGKGLPFPDGPLHLTTIKDLTSISVGDTTRIRAAGTPSDRIRTKRLHDKIPLLVAGPQS